MKGLKAFMASVLCLLAMAPAVARNVGPRLAAMGGVGVAVIDDSQTYSNPASVYFYDGEYSFLLGTYLSDYIGVASWPYVPSTAIKGAFTGQRMALDFSVSFDSENPRESGNVDVYQTTTIDVNLSAGYGPVSAGLGISGGSVRQRLDVPMDHMGDYLMQLFLAQYDRVVNSEFLQVKAGLMVKRNQLSLGVLFDNILDKDGAKTTFNFRTLFAHTGIGFYWSRDEYSKRGQMNHLVYSLAGEIDNLFTSSSRCMNLGGELVFRLVRDFSISARAGYSHVFSHTEQSRYTFGVGLYTGNLKASTYLEFPNDGPISISMNGTLEF